MADVAGNGRVAFFSRCRPSGGAEQADPIEIVLRERRVFIGYPAWREGIEPRRGHLLEALIDFWCPEGEWQAFRTSPEQGKIRHYQKNRNFVRSIKPGR